MRYKSESSQNQGWLESNHLAGFHLMYWNFYIYHKGFHCQFQALYIFTLFLKIFDQEVKI